MSGINRLTRFLSNADNKLIYAMFLPILIEQLILALMSTVHSLMLARVREHAVYIVSAVNLSEQLNQLAFAIIGCVSLGATVIVSQYVGARKLNEAKKAAETAMLLSVVVAAVMTAVFLIFGEHIFVILLGADKTEGETFVYAMQYLRLSVISYPFFNIGATAAGVIRGTGDAKSPIRISLVTGALNAAVAGILIYGFELNIYGAGIALIVSRFFGAVVAFALMFRKGYISSIANLFKPKLLYVKQIMRIGLYGSAENLIFQFGRTITFRNFTGDIHIAANSVTGALFNIIAAPANSMSIVAMALIGRLTGAGERDQSYKVLRNTIILSMAMLLITNLLFLPISPDLIGFYTSNFAPENLMEIRGLINQLVMLLVIFMPVSWSAAFILFSGMRGAGDVRYTTIVSVGTMWAVRVLFAYILGDILGWGVIGVWSAMCADWVVRGVFAVVRFRSRKWQNKATIESSDNDSEIKIEIEQNE